LTRTGTVSSTNRELAEAIAPPVSDSAGHAGISHATPMPSALEFFHPDGPGRRVSVHGAGPAAALVPAPAPGAAASPDLVLLAPTRGERTDGAWSEQAARVASTVANDGLVVAPHPSRRLRSRLAAAGLEPAARLLHVPDLPQSRYVFPLGGPAARFALEQLVPLGRAKRAAARALALSGVSAIAPTSVIFRRRGARPLFDWLSGVAAPTEARTAIVSSSWRPHGATVLHRFGAAHTPDAVVKLGGGAAEEARALGLLGAEARTAEVDVPAVLATGTRAGLPLIAETPVAGSPASGLLRGSPARAAGLLRGLFRWLEAWNAATAAPRPFGRPDGERLLLGPARRLAPGLADADAHLSRLDRLVEACTGRPIPFVAAHNDLTAANVLVDEKDRLGIVDWEHAAPDCLPLGDLAYAVADVAAAVGGSRNRPEEFAFAPGGALAGLTRELLHGAARSLGIEAPAVELCLEACWLRHADNELRKLDGQGERPFLSILERSGAEGVRP
jgi:phosphotransferase family enzyme